jgi:hypothetical protein
MLQNTWDNLGVGIIVVITTRDKHYFDENEIEEGSKVNCNIVVSKPELSEEDKANLKEKAMEQYKEEQLRELRRQSQPKATAPKHTATAPKAGAEINVQPSLFDL